MKATDISGPNRYLTADYERLNFSLSQCIFESGAQPNIVTIESIATANTSSQASSQASSHSSIGGGAIAGIVIAVVVVVAALSLFLIWMRKKKKLLFKHSTAELSAEDDSNLETESGPQNEEAVNLSPELEGSTMKPLAEAVKMPLVEMEDAGTIDPLSGYFAPKAGQEMEDNTPAAQELSSPDAQIHEMFDESVFRELRADVPASNNRTTHPQTPENGRRFSWVQTPLSAVDGPVLPTYQTHNSEITTIPSDTEQSASYTTEKKEVVEEGPLLHPEGHLSVPIVTPSSRSEQSADLDVPPRVSPSLSEQSTDLEDPPRIAPDRAVSSSTPPEPEGTT